MKKNVLIFIISSILFGCEEEKENGWVGAYSGEANYTDFNGRKCTLTFFGSADNNSYRVLFEGPIDFDTNVTLTPETDLSIDVAHGIGYAELKEIKSLGSVLKKLFLHLECIERKLASK